MNNHHRSVKVLRRGDLAKLTGDFAATGQGLQADADRLATELVLVKSRLAEVDALIEKSYIAETQVKDLAAQVDIDQATLRVDDLADAGDVLLEQAGRRRHRLCGEANHLARPLRIGRQADVVRFGAEVDHTDRSVSRDSIRADSSPQI